MAAVASVQAVTHTDGKPATAGQGTAQANGDTGFLATLDGIIQALSAVEGAAAGTATAAKATTATPANTATPNPDPDVSDKTAAVPEQAAQGQAKTPVETTAAVTLDATNLSQSQTATPPAALPASPAEAAVQPADPDAAMLVTLAQPVKFPTAMAVQAKTQATVPSAPVSPVAPEEDASSAELAPIVPTPDNATPLFNTPTAKTAKAAGAADNQSGDATVPAATATGDTASTLMLASVASQMQSVAVQSSQPQPAQPQQAQSQPAQSTTVAGVAVATAGTDIRQAPLPQPQANGNAFAQVMAEKHIAAPQVSTNSTESVPTVSATTGKTSAALSLNAGNIGNAGVSSSATATASASPDNADPSTDNALPGDAAVTVLVTAPAAEVRTKTLEATDATPATGIVHVQSGDLTLSIQQQPVGATDAAKASIAAASPVAASPVEQVSVVVQKGLADGRTSMTIALDPADLGKVEVKLDIAKDGSVQANVIADNANTLNLLKNDNAGLHQALHNAGYTTDSSSLNFSLRGDNQNQNQSQSFAQAQQQQQSSRNSTSYSIQAVVADENVAPVSVTGTQYALSTGNSHVDLFV